MKNRFERRKSKKHFYVCDLDIVQRNREFMNAMRRKIFQEAIIKLQKKDPKAYELALKFHLFNIGD